MLNRSETMPKKAFTLSLPENVTRVFNLHDGKDGSNQCNSPQPSAQERLASICSVACDVVRHNTPRLTEAQWDSILGAVQAGACWDWALELRQVANRSSDHLATMIYDDESFDSEADLHAIMGLTAVERLAAFLVADRFLEKTRSRHPPRDPFRAFRLPERMCLRG
ncbi:MAG: hypothetical protein Q4615_15475 [Paracoccus aminovorans]|nr:hypothetical protein [Paracoccus aminovorans]